MTRAKLHKEDIPKCVRMKKRGMLDKDIAAALGVRPDTFSTWINHPKTENQTKLSKALKEAESEAKEAMLAAIQKAGVGGQWQAAAWYLERKYPREFARPEVQLAMAQADETAQHMVDAVKDMTVKIKEAAYAADRTND